MRPSRPGPSTPQCPREGPRCIMDAGKGRFIPCEVLYKSKKCMIDEGNGRHTPCEALVKQKKTKKKVKAAKRATRCYSACTPDGGSASEYDPAIRSESI